MIRLSAIVWFKAYASTRALCRSAAYRAVHRWPSWASHTFKSPSSADWTSTWGSRGGQSPTTLPRHQHSHTCLHTHAQNNRHKADSSGNFTHALSLKRTASHFWATHQADSQSLWLNQCFFLKRFGSLSFRIHAAFLMKCSLLLMCKSTEGL